ncbi:hypothetical protein Terro_3997 [Terriglobus roseus DSM 18391]|uniref:Uncharacterized protein n=2 Tax=Terriglobus roseus TaxID=392734 RepID=I3ZLT7_TERRK|nr:hypothetical protein Terro_3997 [Terriglobus roseus DSM 18391]
MRFVWDADKAFANVTKHGLSFEKACEVFFDPLMQLWDASPNDDSRLAAVGATMDREVLFVVHVDVEDTLVRIISARHATRTERERYEEHQ